MSFRRIDDYEQIPLANDFDEDSSDESNNSYEGFYENREEQNLFDQISTFGIGLFKKTSNAVKNAYNTAKTKAMTRLYFL